MAEARVLYGGQGGSLLYGGGSFLYGGGSWWPGIPSLTGLNIQDSTTKRRVSTRDLMDRTACK